MNNPKQMTEAEMREMDALSAPSPASEKGGEA